MYFLIHGWVYTGVNLIRISRIRPSPFGRTIGVRLISGHSSVGGLEVSKLKIRSYGATVPKSFIRAWCTYLPTYIEDLCVLVDSGEAGEAESLLAIPKDFPVRLAGFTCLNVAAKKYEECDLKKTESIFPFPSSFLNWYLCNRWHCTFQRKMSER